VSNTTAVRQLASSMAAETSRGPVYGQDLSTATFVMNELVAQVNSEMSKSGTSEAVMSFIKDISVVSLFRRTEIISHCFLLSKQEFSLLCVFHAQLMQEITAA